MRSLSVALDLAILAILACSCSSSGNDVGARGPGGTETGGTWSLAGAAGGSSTSAGGAGGSSTSGGGASGTSCTSGAATTLPRCTAAVGSSIDIRPGCKPTVDGSYHAGEWDDATCLSVGNDPVYLKYAGGALYLAWSMTPTCGCGAQLAFSKDSSPALDGSQFDLALLDDPFGASGDASEFVSKAGGWGTAAAVANGIVIANPPNQPSPVTYEVSIPFLQLGITAGQAAAVGMALLHASVKVPSGLTLDATVPSLPANPASWLSLTSSANWK